MTYDDNHRMTTPEEANERQKVRDSMLISHEEWRERWNGLFPIQFTI
jgi:hypothetical protein